MITKSYLPYARVLARSWAEHHPDAGVTAMLVDAVDGRFDPSDEPFDVVLASDVLPPELLGAMALRYDAFDFSMALKPWLIRHVLTEHERAVYLDSDIRVYAPFHTAEAALDDAQILLTPHFLHPVPDDDFAPSEPAILKAGAYNAGFVGFRRGPETDRMLEWWGQRLEHGSIVDVGNGYFVDQHWLDLVPSLFGDVALLRDRGANVAYWNVNERPIAGTHEDGYTAGGVPLRFFHFTGFAPTSPERLSEYGSRVVPSKGEPLFALMQDYAAEVREADFVSARRWRYSWGATKSGIVLTPTLRATADLEDAPPADVFTREGERRWLDHLTAPAEKGRAFGLTRLQERIHDDRDDLRSRFLDLDADGGVYLAWLEDYGAEEIDVPIDLLTQTASHASRTPGLCTVAADDDLGLDRDDVVVAIPVYNAPDLFAECLDSVLRNTPVNVPVLVADDASPDPTIGRLLEELGAAGELEHELLYLRQPENLGFVGNVNAALAVAAPADVVVLNSDCVVGPRWLAGMRSAAYDDTNVATATPLTNHGTIVSVPDRNVVNPSLPQDADFRTVAMSVYSTSQRLRPRLPTCVGHCMYIRRDAIELVGPFDEAFAPAYGEEVDFSQRCSLRGLTHVAADDVFVLHRQGGSLSVEGERNPIQDEHERILAARYPYYGRLQHAFANDPTVPLGRATANARRAMQRLSVTIDGRVLGPIMTGTQVHVLELINALSETGEVLIRVVVPFDLGDYAAGALRAMPRVEFIRFEDVGPHTPKTDLAHRPFQVSSIRDLEVLRQTGERWVITQQDLIAYRNPGYFPGYTLYDRYKRLTRRALAMADRVVFFSHHAERDVLGEQLVDPTRSEVVYIGVDHRVVDVHREPVAPLQLADLPDDEPLLLCLGTDFRHKNRVFALRLLDELQRRHGWDGRLVLAGPRVAQGSSAGEEAAYLATHPHLAAKVTTLPAVDEGQKAWLYERASALVYPTLYEGFGLMPFEAAEFDTPCLFAAQASLREVLPPEAAVLVPWDAAASADATMKVLQDADERARLLDLVRRAGERFAWGDTGRRLVKVYRAAVASPIRHEATLALDADVVAVEQAETERKYIDLWGGLTADARELVRPDGLLSPEQQRTLRAALENPRARAGLMRALALARRLRDGDEEPIERPTTKPDEFVLHWWEENQRHMDEVASGRPLPEDL